MEELEKLFSKAKNHDEVGAELLKSMARKDMKHFLEIFRKDYAEIIDWSKGIEILDDLLEQYVSKRDLKKKDAFFFLVSAFRKNGTPIRFIINTQVDLKEGQIKVGIADLPDEESVSDEEEEEMDAEDMLALFAQNFMDKLKSGKLKPLDNSPNCSRCGRSDLPLTITIDAVNIKTEKICAVCMRTGGAHNRPQKPKKVSELDSEIAEYEELAKNYEQLIKDHPEPDNTDSELAKYAMTPLSNYRAIQAVLADLKAQRMQAMTSMDDSTRLKYELKKAVAAEDYAKSAEIRDKLKKLKSKD